MELDVLIVDDDEDIREYTADIMANWKGLGGQIKFKYHFAEDGMQALDLLHKNKYDLLIADVKMPRLSGAQLITALRTNKGANQNIPTIIISGAPEAYVSELQNEEWTDVFSLDKPIDQDKFGRVITFSVAIKMKQAG